MILFERPYVTLELDEPFKCLTQRWKGFADSQQFREGITKSLEVFQQKQIDKIISDTQNASLVKKEDTDWVATTITPKLVQCGLRRIAFIIPANVFTQMSVDNFKNETKGGVRIQYFDDYEKAKEWISKA